MKNHILFTLVILLIFFCYLNISAQDSWTCENGHEGNTGNFCTECGAPKLAGPAAATLSPVNNPVSTPAAVSESTAKLRKHTIWQNKKLIVDALPGYMFVSKDIDETEEPRNNTHDHYEGESCNSTGATWGYLRGEWICANG